MKRKKTVLLAVSLLTFAMISSTGLTSCACGEGETVDANLYKPRIIVGDSNGWGRVGDTIQLSAVVQGDSDNAVTWSTLDASVATVDSSGLVTLVGVGTCNIEATSVKDPTKKTATQINVSDKLENRLVVYSQPSKVKYKIGEQVSYAGLKVMGFSYVDGVQVSTSGTDFANTDLTFSLAEGTALTKAGATTVTVSKSGYVSCSFTITAADTVRTKKLYISSYPASTYVLKEGEKMGIETIKAYVNWCKENNLNPSHAENVFKYKNKKSSLKGEKKYETKNKNSNNININICSSCCSNIYDCIIISCIST